MVDRELAQRVVDYLNDLRERDPAAIHALVETRTPCNEALADHPTCQVAIEGSQASVGLLGVLNGLCGVDSQGWGPIAAHYDGDLLTGFSLRDKPADGA